MAHKSSRRSVSLIERLESRTFLSASPALAQSGALLEPSAIVAAKTPKPTTKTTIKAVAGTIGQPVTFNVTVKDSAALGRTGGNGGYYRSWHNPSDGHANARHVNQSPFCDQRGDVHHPRRGWRDGIFLRKAPCQRELQQHQFIAEQHRPHDVDGEDAALHPASRQAESRHRASRFGHGVTGPADGPDALHRLPGKKRDDFR